MGFNKKILSKKEEVEQRERDFRDHNLTSLPSIVRTLFAAVDAIEENHLPYALIGGIAVKELGRPRVTHDIDVFVKPDDADEILDILASRGFEIEKRDPFWLYKAWRDNVLVDIIFRSSGDLYFEEEVMSHVRRIPYHGRYVNAISPEDFIVIKAAAHKEETPHHWHDALAVITQGNLDWEYLLRRAKHSSRRVLALLIYAQSNDVAVPSEAIQKLYRSIFEPPAYCPEPLVHPYRKDATKVTPNISNPEVDSPIYIKGRIMEALTSDERIAEHDIKVVVGNSVIVTRGEVFTEEQKTAVDEVIQKLAPSMELQNEIHVRILSAPGGSEVIT